MVLALPDRDVERVLAIIAHPDDAEFWAGGTIVQWTDEGIQQIYTHRSTGQDREAAETIAGLIAGALGPPT